jgi:hypothetical protein
LYNQEEITVIAYPLHSFLGRGLVTGKRLAISLVSGQPGMFKQADAVWCWPNLSGCSETVQAVGNSPLK